MRGRERTKKYIYAEKKNKMLKRLAVGLAAGLAAGLQSFGNVPL